MKRSRLTEMVSDETPSVSVTFSALPKASQEVLREKILEWGRWHALEFPPQILAMVPGVRMSGSVNCDPALFTEGSVAAWIEIPSATSAAVPRADFNIKYEMESEAPKYDRSGNVLEEPSPQALKAKASGFQLVQHQRNQLRCFNCGSYSHGLKECWHQCDDAAIDLARAEAPGGRDRAASTRYFGAAAQPGEKQEFQGLQPGKLSTELRTALGLGPVDPPPWLHRMRQLGYPPGYLSKAEPDDEEPEEERIDFLDDAHARPVLGLPLDGIPDEAAQSPPPDPGDRRQLEDEQPADDNLDFIPFGQGSDSGDMQLSQGAAAQAEVSEARTSATPSTDPSDSSQQATLPLLATTQPQHGDAARQSRARGREQQLVQFPGINAPLPEGADPKAWAEQARSGPGQKMGPASRAVDIPPAKRPRLATHSSASAVPQFAGSTPVAYAPPAHPALQQPPQPLHSSLSADHAQNGLWQHHMHVQQQCAAPAHHLGQAPPPPSPFLGHQIAPFATHTTLPPGIASVSSQAVPVWASSAMLR